MILQVWPQKVLGLAYRKSDSCGNRFLSLALTLLGSGVLTTYAEVVQAELVVMPLISQQSLGYILHHTDLPSITAAHPLTTLSSSPRRTPTRDRDREIFHTLMQRARQQALHQQPLADVIQWVAQQFLGAPYQAGLLDRGNSERLVISLQKFDCVLFVETVLAIAQSITLQDHHYEQFRRRVESLRYWQGQRNGYCSRLHYFVTWVADNQQRQNVSDLTPRLSQQRLSKSLRFMSQNRHKYTRLFDDTQYRCILKLEQQFTTFAMPYIPTDAIHQQARYLQPGDIIAIATRIPGLDVTHTGLVYRNPNGSLGLIHAAPGRGVYISPDLQSFVAEVQDSVGILVVRPLPINP